jgi:hypothetical protein
VKHCERARCGRLVVVRRNQFHLCEVDVTLRDVVCFRSAWVCGKRCAVGSERLSVCAVLFFCVTLHFFEFFLSDLCRSYLRGLHPLRIPCSLKIGSTTKKARVEVRRDSFACTRCNVLFSIRTRRYTHTDDSVVPSNVTGSLLW